MPYAHACPVKGLSRLTSSPKILTNPKFAAVFGCGRAPQTLNRTRSSLNRSRVAVCPATLRGVTADISKALDVTQVACKLRGRSGGAHLVRVMRHAYWRARRSLRGSRRAAPNLIEVGVSDAKRACLEETYTWFEPSVYAERRLWRLGLQ